MKPVTSSARTVWNGNLLAGNGTTELTTTGVATFNMNWKARSEEGGKDAVTTPEELLAGAHSACFAMAFSNALDENGTPPNQLTVTADIVFENVAVTTSTLSVVADVPGLDADKLKAIAEDAKANCPVSKALAGVEIILNEATLAS